MLRGISSMSEIMAIGTGLIGAFVGLIIGFISAKFLGLTPNAKQLQQALATNEEYYKTQVSRWRGRIKEYEQPSELQQIAAGAEGLEQGDLVQMVINNIGGIKSLPRWVRPFLPAIQGYIKENPEKVQQIISKFLQQSGGNKQQAEMNLSDSL